MKEDWIECKFADVLNIKNGKNQKLVENPEGIYPIYGSSGIIGWADEYLCEEETTIIGRKGTINTPIFVNTKFWNVDTAFGLTPYKILNSRLLFYFCKLFNFHALDKSTTIPSLAKSDLLQIDFTLPPLSEQRAIVKKLESLFSSLDAGVADLKKAQQQLKIYRQAVLKKAFEGITETIILNDAGVWKGGGTPSTQNKDFWENGNINWVSSQDVKTKYIEDTERKITGVAIENSSTKWIEKNALLFVVRSGILRRIFPIGIAKVDLCVNQDIQTLTLNEKYLTEFVYWYLMGNEYDIRHNCAKDGTTVESIDVSKLKKYKLPACTLEEQNEIVKQIESRLSVCDSIEQNIKESLLKAEALRQSILKKAFEGNLLTAQELAECKQAADYEPASVLLERIKAEHSKVSKPKKKTKTT